MPASRPSNSLSATFAARWLWPLVAGLTFGLFTYASLPPASIWPLALFAPATLIWCGCRGAVVDRPRRAAILAGLGTLPLWFAEEAWLTNVTPVGYPLLALYLAMFSGLTVYAIGVVRASGWKIPMSVAAPLVWVAIEMLRCEVVLTGYPWYVASHPLIEAPLLAMPARLFGAYFVSMLVVAAAGSLVDAAGWAAVSRRAGGIGIASIAAVWTVTSIIGGLGSGTSEAQKQFRIGVVQTNIPQGQKLGWTLEQQIKDFQRFIELTQAAATASPAPQLIAWPETMFTGWALNADGLAAAKSFVAERKAEKHSPMWLVFQGFADVLCEAQQALEVPMVIGCEAREGVHAESDKQGRQILSEQRRYNSVVVVADGRPLEKRYDKVELTPFGEVIPWVWRWPAVQDAVLSLGANGMKFDLGFGRSATPIDVPLGAGKTVRVATPICFEITRSSLCRRLVRGESGATQAGVILNVSNDGWFGSERWWLVPSDAKRMQHLLAGRWRCMELGVPMVRAVNTGISAFVDSRGRLLKPTAVSGSIQATQSEGVFIGSIILAEQATVYGWLGNVCGWGALGGGTAVFVLAWRRRRRVSPL